MNGLLKNANGLKMCDLCGRDLILSGCVISYKMTSFKDFLEFFKVDTSFIICKYLFYRQDCGDCKKK